MCVSLRAQNVQSPYSLESLQPVERGLGGGQSHKYPLTLSAGQYLEVIVAQRGIDVAVRLDAPDGGHLAQFDSDSRPQGQEVVTQIVAVAGTYQIVVDAKQKDAQPGNYLIRLAALRAATDQDRALEEARRQSIEAARLAAARKFDEALPPAQRSLAAREQALGQQHGDVASSLHLLAGIYRDKLDFVQAEPLYLRALAIAEKMPAPGHSDWGLMYNDLGTLYYRKGDDLRAEVQFQRSLTVWEQAFGPNHPLVGRALNNLAAVYNRKGDSTKLEPTLKRSLEIRERTLGPNDAAVAATLNNLGNLYFARQDYERAEPVYQRALKILEQPQGQNVQQNAQQNIGLLAGLIQNLGTIYTSQRKFAEGEAFHLRALGMREKAFGQDDPNVAQSLKNLAELYANQANFAKANPLEQRALAIREKSLGPSHPEVVLSLNSLVRDSLAQGDLQPAIANQTRAAEISERNLVYNFTTGSEREKLAYLSTLNRETNQIISLHLRYAADDAQAWRLSLTTILRRKGRALDSLTDGIAALRRRAAPQDQSLLDQLKTVRAQLAQLVLGGPQGTKPVEHRERINKLEAQREALENEISRRSAEFRAQSQPVTVEAVQALIPRSAALIEFIAYRPFNAKYTQPSEEFGASRYAAYVLRQQGEARWVDLGEKQKIDEAIGEMRRALRDRKRRDFTKPARTVDRLVMQPLRPLLGRSRRVLIAPDGGINLIPFAALVDQRGELLIRRYSFSYLTSGRDLLRLQVKQPSKQSALIIANPDFGEEAGTTNGLTSERILRYRAGTSSDQNNSPHGETGKAAVLANAYFPPLPGTGGEAQALKTLLPDSTLLINQQATEAMLKQASGPLILHIATHGFFLEDAMVQETGTRLLVTKSTAASNTTNNSPLNPLLRSGLALAGANQPSRDSNNEEDGILTALEAADLNLWGTKLVVLSACETGLGEVKDGEGVYGLRRALVLAGAEAQVMSLWAVSDLATRNLMIEYYRRLQRGEGRAEAMRQAQLSLLNQPRRRGVRDYSHPYYWAGFIQSGEWANLDGQR